LPLYAIQTGLKKTGNFFIRDRTDRRNKTLAEWTWLNIKRVQAKLAKQVFRDILLPAFLFSKNEKR
jgi:hypothetical protein